MDTYANHVYDPNVLTKSLPKAVATYTERVKQVFDQGSDLGIDENAKPNE